ncbi:MAG TPA: glycosyltransferase family 4 protein [Caldimonas sp.]|nr:glycosyltransferase family 4 protein [Caldimonas sp.]HEX2541930.1 glycosyltransferase family 4 protein [Caldimonas sp.]
MKIAYLLNSYPMTSTTFIRREIEALEDLGLTIRRYAVRRWDQALVEPLDIEEQQRTHYLLSGNAGGLLAAFFLELVSNPAGLGRGVALWLRLCLNARALSPRLVAYLVQACYLRRRTRADGIAHVHVHFATNAAAVAMLAHAMGGPSFSFTAHGPDEFVDAAASSMKLKVQRAAFVIAISQFCRVQLLSASDMDCWDKIVVARCGIDLGAFTPDYDIAADNHQLVCIGRLCTQKGQLLIPRAIAQLRSEFPGLRVHCVGDGEIRGRLQRAIEECRVEQHVQLHGWQGGAVIRKLLAESRALLLPSFAEGLPIVIMEAFASGRPVLSTFIAGIPELVDDRCGWIFPAGSIDDLAEAMRAALRATPAVLRDKAVEGRARVERLHDLRVLASTLRQCFAQVTQERAGDAQPVRA